MDLKNVYIEFIITSWVINFSAQVKESKDKSRINIFTVYCTILKRYWKRKYKSSRLGLSLTDKRNAAEISRRAQKVEIKNRQF